VLLTREIAQRGHYPAVDVLASLSRLMPDIATPEHRRVADLLRANLAEWRAGRDLVEIGAYAPGTNAKLDEALLRLPAIDAFLRQGSDDLTAIEDTLGLLRLCVEGGAAK
jgi:flagellum-specific ATP synthase